MTAILKDHISRFSNGRSLGDGMAEVFFDALIAETDEGLLASVFRAWRDKGIDEDEIFAVAKIMRGRCLRITPTSDRFVDIVGTGGSRSKTFNVSTASSFITAGAGVAVAKHGNRAATSGTGSADVLAELGIEPAVDAATAERNINELGICFLFAPIFHRLSPTLGKVRRGLGFPTIFNSVGPLCNPAGAKYQVIGVWDEAMVSKMANVLARLGTDRSWVVHGREGLDEISICGKTIVAEIENGSVSYFEFAPESLGIERVSPAELRARSAAESAAMIRNMFHPENGMGPARDLGALNAAAAIFVSGHTPDMATAYELALESIANGRAEQKLVDLAEASKR